jgi:hypothetical protein
MTGFALVSKYPQAIVALPVALATLQTPRTAASRSEKLYRLALAGGGGVLAAALGMPALVVRTASVVRALTYEVSLYAGGASPSYWDQTVRRAEWDLPLVAPEIGWPLLVLAVVAFAAALADWPSGRVRASVQATGGADAGPGLPGAAATTTRATALAWGVYAAALGLLFTRYPFRPWRNLLPLAPLAAVLVGCLYGRLRRAAAAAAAAAAARSSAGGPVAGRTVGDNAAALPAAGGLDRERHEADDRRELMDGDRRLPAPGAIARDTPDADQPAWQQQEDRVRDAPAVPEDAPRRPERPGSGGHGGHGEGGGRGRWWSTAGLLLDAAAVALPLVLFAVPVAAYVHHEATLVDSRRQAVRWLAAHATAADITALADELAFLPSDTATVPGTVRILPWPRMQRTIDRRRSRFVVLGDVLLAGGGHIPNSAWDEEVLPAYGLRAKFGEEPPMGDPMWVWHGNRQRIWILERRGPAPAPAGRPPAAGQGAR